MFKVVINKLQQPNTVVAIGNFDGLHIGHLQLFDKLNQVAKQNNYKRVAITFEPLPLEYFSDINNKQRSPRLCLLRDKFFLFRKYDLIDELVVLHFNTSIANLSPDSFIQSVLKQKLNVVHVVAGYDFKFGKDGLGTTKDLKSNGIDCTIVPPYMLNNQLISSSIIRDLAKDNQLNLVNHYLGRNLHYTSRIIHGNKMGRKFGVPTINLSIGKNRLALHGVYTARVHIGAVSYNAVVNIGKNPTTNNLDSYKLEAHLLGVDLYLYGKIARVEVLQFIREEIKFDNLNNLFIQIDKDVSFTKSYFDCGQDGL